jgi:hypothetical protein
MSGIQSRITGRRVPALYSKVLLERVFKCGCSPRESPLLVAEFARILVLANAIRKSGDFRYIFEDTL